MAHFTQVVERLCRTTDYGQRTTDYDLLMPRLIAAPTVIQAAGNKPKRIEEFAGRVNSGHESVSVARMTSPEGWLEPGQRPEFEELTVVLRGMVRVEYEGGTMDVAAGQAVVTAPGEWVRYSTPQAGGAEYVAVCLPAFSPDTVHRDGP
jgi:mannose-6-phosphate isomerase-like protein (cupin superfamily)